MPFRRISRSSVALFAAAGTALVLAPSVASAQDMGRTASVHWSKTEAILGAPSALQGILAQQQGTARSSAVVPASYSTPRIIDAVVHTAPSDEGAISGRPDLFGSVALQVAHTPLDAKWHAVEHYSLSGAPSRFAAALAHLNPTTQLDLVNRYVNHRVRYYSDEQHFGRPDVWSSATETLRSGRGDCEDYAIAKLQLLRAAGFAQHDLYLVIVHDLIRRADHAVLVARAAGHMFVLDDGTDAVLDSRDVADYRPVLTFASNGEWTHGYRVQHAPMVIAENEAAGTLFTNDQRSRSASLLAFNTGFNR